MKNWIPACAGMTLLLAGCGGSAAIRHQVLTPPPSSPVKVFFVERAQVQSRETGDEAWSRNEECGRVLTEALRSELQNRGKTLANPPADSVRARVYVAYGDAPVRTKDTIKGKAHIEVRLQLLEGNSETVRYSTFTIAPIKPSLLAKMGWAPETEQMIREALQAAARDFASRL
jgi:hypothetical protein